MHVDIAGAGIIGLSIAWRLAQSGCKVTVRDAGRAAGQASWAGAGMLTPAGEFHEESRWTKLAIDSLAAYGAFVAELSMETGVAIDFRVSGAIELAFTEDEKTAMDRPRPDGIVMQSLTTTAACSHAPIPSSGILAARWFPNEAVVDPRNVCDALLAACRDRGVEVRENDQLERCAGPTVIAAGAWATQIGGLGIVPQAFPVKGHLLGYRRKAGSLPSIVRHGHHYALQRANGYILFGSDEQRDVWDTSPVPERVDTLTNAARELLPGLLDGPPDDVWAGVRPGSTAGEPVVGRLPGRNIWLAYGHYRNGILLAPATARLITESILASSETD